MKDILAVQVFLVCMVVMLLVFTGVNHQLFQVTFVVVKQLTVNGILMFGVKPIKFMLSLRQGMDMKDWQTNFYVN